MPKQDLRHVLLTQRGAIPAEHRLQQNSALNANVLAWWERNPVDKLGVYQAIRGEPGLHATYMELAHRGVQLALPIVVDANMPLQFAQWSPGDTLVVDKMQVPVPMQPHSMIDPQALLIPCVGFNQQCIRLGYGGGFYDRTLAAHPRPKAIGVAFSWSLVNFAAGAHDIPLDLIITENEHFIKPNLVEIE